MSEASDQIREMLGGVTISRSRTTNRLNGAEITRITELLETVVSGLEARIAELETAAEEKPKPQWYGISFPPGRPVVTADKKNGVYIEFLRREGLESVADRVMGTSAKDDESGKRIYYYYVIPTTTGPVFLYVVHSDYLDRIPKEILQSSGLIGEDEEIEEEENDDE